MIIPVILSGGSGSRLWPLARTSLPKQFLALHGQRTMIQETALRVAGFAAPIIICNEAHRFLVTEQMRDIGIVPQTIVLEPEGRNTAPAAAIAALLAAERDPSAIVVLLPSDHLISNHGALLEVVDKAIAAAEAGKIVTFGVTPTAPETGYGYIKQGQPDTGLSDIRNIERFVEKPDLATAESYLLDGRYLWNSGMFVFRADAMLREFEMHCSAVLHGARGALMQTKRTSEFLRLDPEAFHQIKPVSLDYAVMERTIHAAVVPCEIGWSDVGSWSSLWQIDAKNAQGNVFHGDVISQDAAGNFVHSQNIVTALVGVKDLVVVTTPDAVLVADRTHSQNVKAIFETLKAQYRKEADDPARVRKPWGSYQNIDSAPGYLVKQIDVNPGGRLSLQMHHKRAEHWVVVQGTARVTCDDRVFDLNVNETTFIPLGAKHRLENFGDTPLRLIEVQIGSYVGEDDIVRFDDVYGRADVSDQNQKH